MALTSGAKLGPYEIVEPLGAGGMGEVYRARDTKLGRDVALKILPPQFTADPDRAVRFKREAQLLADLNHPHIGAPDSGSLQPFHQMAGRWPSPVVWTEHGRALCSSLLAARRFKLHATQSITSFLAGRLTRARSCIFRRRHREPYRGTSGR